MNAVAAYSPSPGLRTWQSSALEAWHRHREGIVEVVTGGGKTRFALEVIRTSWQIEPSVRVLVVVPSVALQDQWVVEVQDYFGEVAGTSRSDLSGRTRIVVLVVDTARRVVEEMDDSIAWLQVVDECHRIASPENRKALMKRTWGSLGLSATPERQYDDLLELFVVPILGPIIIRYGYAAAIADGVITAFRLVNIEVWMTDSESDELARLSRRIAVNVSRYGAHDERSKRAMLARARMLQGVESRIPTAVELILRGPDEPTIVFHESVEGANRIADILRRRGVRTGIYHSKVSVEARRRDLHMFRLGALDVLVCCRALDEGLNVPRASRAVIAASTASTRQRIQRLGRIVRPHGTKQWPTVYTLWASEAESTRLAQEAEGLEGLAKVEWLKAGVA